MGCGWDGGNDGMSLVHHWESLGTDLEGSLLPPRAQVRVRLGERGRDCTCYRFQIVKLGQQC